MDYLKHYLALCQGRQDIDRSKSNKDYFESHHIIPKSLGGDDSISNLVLLTAKEHYLAHLLLYRYYKQFGGKALQKMAFALVSMSAYNNTNLQREEITSSRTYATIKEAARLAVLGRKVGDTSNYQKPKSKAHANAISKARLNAQPRNKETRQKMRESALRRGSNFTGNHIDVSCPNCNKTGQKNAMLRWHFDNCKVRKEVANA